MNTQFKLIHLCVDWVNVERESGDGSPSTVLATDARTDSWLAIIGVGASRVILPAIHSFGILPRDEDGSLVPPRALASSSLRVAFLVSTGRLSMSFFSLQVTTVVL